MKLGSGQFWPNPISWSGPAKKNKKLKFWADIGPTILGQYWPISSGVELGLISWADPAHMF